MRLQDFWTVLQERLDSPTMQESLGGRGRVYRPTDEIPEHESEPSAPWGRIVMMARSTLWPQVEQEPGDPYRVAFLLSVQFNDFVARGYDVGIPVQAVHEEALAQLDNFAPELEDAMIFVPLYRFATPPASPVYDASRQLWLSNAEYRTEVTSLAEV